MKYLATPQVTLAAIPASMLLFLGMIVSTGAQTAPRERDSYEMRPGAHGLPEQEDARINPGVSRTSRGAQTGLPDSFFRAIRSLCLRLNCEPRDLLGVMMRESGLRPDAWNRSSNAVGLVQFLPSTLARLEWDGTPEQFRALSAEEQLPFVERFLRASSSYNLNSAGRIYQAIFMPASLRTATSDDSALIDRRGVNADRYQRNRGLDLDGDGRITVGELQQSIEVVFNSAKWQPIEDRLAELSRGGRPAANGVRENVGSEVTGESTIAPRASHIREISPRRPSSGPAPGMRVDVPLGVRRIESFVRTVDLRTKQGVKEGLAILGFRPGAYAPWSALRAFQDSVRLRGDGFAGGKTRAALALALNDLGVRTLNW